MGRHDFSLSAVSGAPIQSGSKLTVRGLRLAFMALVSPLWAVVRYPVWMLGLYAAMLPLDQALGLGGTLGSITRYAGIVLIAVIWVNRLLAPQGRIRRPGYIHAGWGVFLLWALIVVFWSVDPSRSLGGVVTLAGLLLINISVAVFPFTELDYLRVKRLVMLAGITTAAFVLMSYASGVGAVSGGIRGSFFLHVRGARVDPNYFSVSLLLPVTFLLYQVMCRRYVWTPGLLIVLAAVLLTGSGGGFLGLSGATLVVLWRGRFGMRRLGALVAVVLVVVLAFLGVSEIAAAPSDLWSRFTLAQWVETGGTGRFSIWERGIDAFVERPIHGYGLRTYQTVQSLRGDRASSSHSIWLDALLELGTIGLVLLVVMLLAHWRGVSVVSRDFSEAVPLEGALIGTLISCSFLTSLLTFKPLWLLLGLSLMLAALPRSAPVSSQSADVTAPCGPMVAGSGN